MLTGSQVRRKFLDFFVQKGHREVHSSSLVPANDPTLLFTNAGMNQFKDVFLGLEKRDYNRATTSQKCVRAGGKHNDLENVGFTNRHHTFFEMLGNFSFGDYFKKDAIAYAWELITSPEWFGIPKDKLFVTIFEGADIPHADIPRDDEAEQFWLDVGVPKERIFAMGMKDNFWQMGDTGPCGPCSEIHYDMGPAASELGHSDCRFPCDCGRYIEIWNLVFMQYNRSSRTIDGAAVYGFSLLPKPSIDTGAGLERLAAALLNVSDPAKFSNYDTDLFQGLIRAASGLTEVAYGADFKGDASLRIIADHARAATFLISDGVTPSNDGRGYVLRKIIRRAIRHGRLLGTAKPFLHRMSGAVRDVMDDAYPELADTHERVATTILDEEKRFARTLEVGWQKMEEVFGRIILELQGAVNVSAVELTLDGNTGILKEPHEQKLSGIRRQVAILRAANPDIPLLFPGSEAFKLYETYGLPKDFIQESCRDMGFDFDESGFDTALRSEQSRARASWRGAAKQTANPEYQKLPASKFEGYEQTISSGPEVLAILEHGQGATKIENGHEGEVILDYTPFYAESGGQVGDLGTLFDRDSGLKIADVVGCYFPVSGVRSHRVRANADIRIGQHVIAKVDRDIRESTMRNHTATHLLHAGLREVLGKHVKQAGSLVDPNHLRFDFSHFTAVEDEELQDIEDIINKEVLRNEKIQVIENVPIDVAINEYHAMALFGEKYGDKVRVIKIGDFSTELCGGTHTSQTGEIGLIKVLKEGSVSSGVRRVEAITGEGSLQHFRKDHQLENVVASLTSRESEKSPADALKAELEKKDTEIKRLARELDQARMKSASSSAANIGDKIKDVHGIKVLVHRVDNLERPQMRTLVDQLRDKLGTGVVVLGSTSNGNVSLIVGVTKDLTSRIQAGKVIGPVAQKVGGKGGGRPDLAEAGGKDPAALDGALNDAYGVVEKLLAG
jgi:alanyl-tRNA synthetase